MAVFSRTVLSLVVLELFQVLFLVNCQELLFSIGTRILQEGDSVNIADIEGQPGERSDPGNTLVCNTTNLTIACCRNAETGSGSIGNWHNPMGEAVVSLNNLGESTDTFYRVVYTQQVRLGSEGSPSGPLGTYTCRVPDGNEGEFSGSINLISTLSVSTVSITPSNPEVVAGESLTLTCTATTTGRGGNPSFSWTGQETRGPQIGQPVEGSTNMFSDSLTIQRVSQINQPTVQCDVSTSISSMSDSVMLAVTVPPTSATISENVPPTIGQTYILTCNVDNPSALTLESYSWMRGSTLLTGESNQQLNLGTLQLSHNRTRYTCHYTASSPYLTSDVMGTSATHEVIITVTVSSVSISPLRPIGVAGVDDVTFTCTGTLSGPAIATLTWTGPTQRTPTSLSEPASTITDSFMLTRLRQSYAGTYTCTVSIGASSMSRSVKLRVTAPAIPISITNSQAPVGLRDYILTCNVSPPSSIAVTSPTYQWSRNGQVQTSQTNRELNLSPLQPTENGARYSCRYRASSVYVTNVDVVSTTHTITSITIAPLTAAPTNIQGTPQPTSVMLTWMQSELDIVDNYMISYMRLAGCPGAPSDSTTIAGSLREYTLTSLEENTTYNISITAINTRNSLSSTEAFTTQTAAPTGRVNEIVTGPINFTSITITWQPVDCLLQNSPITSYNIRYTETGLTTGPLSTTDTSFTATSLFPGTSYMFEIAAVNSHGEGPYTQYQVSTQQTNSILLLKGRSYSNNSIITISDIGENSEALFCFTAENQCCRNRDMFLGGPRDWHFPNEDKVGNRMANSISRNRGPGSVILHRDNVLTPTGIYRCEIYGENIYVGLYADNEGSPQVQSIAYNTTTGIVTCISSGGPVTNLTWNKNGKSYQPSKIIVNTASATYHNLLNISSTLLSDYTGIFMCTVSNSRGSTSRATEEYKSIGLSGNRNTYNAGSTASVICFSNLTVVSMQWKNKTSDISFSTDQIRNNELQLNIDDVITQDTHGTSFTCEVTHLLPNDEMKKETMTFTIRTQEELSGPVRSLSLSASGSSVQITWMPPDMPNGVITGYYLRLLDLKINNAVASTNLFGNQTSYTQSGLDAGVPYEVNISPINSIGLGENMINIFFTQELKSLESPSLMVQRTSATMMMLSWTPLTLVQARGFVTNYTIYYSVSNTRKRQEPSAMSITVASNITSTTIDGLDENVAYSVQISANNGAGTGSPGMAFTVAQFGTNVSNGGTTTVIGIVVGIVLAAIAVAIIVTVVLFIMKSQRSSKYTPTNELVMYSKENEKKSPISASPQKPTQKKPLKPPKELEANFEQSDDQTYENTAFLVKDRLKPVPIDEFGAHICRMHADRDKWFEMEYNSIEKSAKLDYKTAIIPENRARNRFGNIYPYDFNRVVLNSIPDLDHSDYINASYVNGFGRKKVYIAAQGPMENSIDDFWRMIWEEKSPTIVMLTRVFEGKKKCEEYWPQSTSDPFVPSSESSFVIELKSSLPFAEFVVKEMTIKKTDGLGSRNHDVTLFHYLGWPDHGVPANAISMINFIRRVRKSHPYSNTDLMVVHCSAGVGRTGTFITLDYMLERIKTEKSINTYQFVSELRKQRVLMVQTVAQYVFIHNALDELLSCGDTEVAAANMRIVIGKLSRPVEAGSKDSGFQRQYDILNKVTSELRSVDFSQSVNAANSDKNRYDDRIPFNHTRVRLRPAAAQGSDYINASFVEGYRQKGAYIATQGPLPHTVNDFWRLIWEQECRCIVMLCKTEENGKEVCHRYWPQGKGSSEDYGKLTVTVTDQKAFSDYVVRKLEISEKQTRMSVTPTGFSITQFQYLRWQEDTVPNSTSAILEIANLVQKVQMSTGNKSILVMCNDGVGRSGTFITIHAQMERMKSEAVIDVFQFIKSVRFQRAGLVANKDQYAFCYQVLADFLDGFDTYANFKEII